MFLSLGFFTKNPKPPIGGMPKFQVNTKKWEMLGEDHDKIDCKSCISFGAAIFYGKAYYFITKLIATDGFKKVQKVQKAVHTLAFILLFYYFSLFISKQ